MATCPIPPTYPGEPLSPDPGYHTVLRDTDGSIYHAAPIRKLLPEPFVWSPGMWAPICSYCGIVATLNDMHLAFSHAKTCAWALWRLEQPKNK